MRIQILLTGLIIFLLGIASAGTIELLKNEYSSSETLQAYLKDYTGSPASNIYLLDANDTKIGIAQLVVEYEENKYFVYFTLPNNLKDGEHDLVVVSDRVSFNVSNSNNSLKIKPGIFVLNKGLDDLTLQLGNNGEESLTVTLSSSDSGIVFRKTVVSLDPGKQQNVFADFDFDELQGDSEIIVGYGEKNYVIPVIVEKEENVEENITEEIIIEEEPVEDALVFVAEKTEQRLNLTKDNTIQAQLIIRNNLQEDIDVNVELTGDLSNIMNIRNTPTRIKANEDYVLNLIFNEGKGALPKTYQGDLEINSEKGNVFMPFYVEVYDEEVEVSAEPDFNWTEQAIVEEEKGADPVVIIGVVMICILLVILAILYFKMKEKPKKEFSDVIKERTR